MAGTGGKRVGAGRKSKAEELGLSVLLQEVFTYEERKKVFQMLLDESLNKRSTKHAELLLAYYYGKPSQHVVSDNATETIIKIVRGDTDTTEQLTSSTEENTLTEE